MEGQVSWGDGRRLFYVIIGVPAWKVYHSYSSGS